MGYPHLSSPLFVRKLLFLVMSQSHVVTFISKAISATIPSTDLFSVIKLKEKPKVLPPPPPLPLRKKEDKCYRVGKNCRGLGILFLLTRHGSRSPPKKSVSSILFSRMSSLVNDPSVSSIWTRVLLECDEVKVQNGK